MDTLGRVYYKKGLYGSAIGEFPDCLTRIPETPAVIYHLGMAYCKNGDAQKARVELEKALGWMRILMGLRKQGRCWRSCEILYLVDWLIG